MEAWLMQSQSLGILIVMAVGYYYRRQRQKHVKIMSFAMIWDVCLILQIELSRSAILKATRAVSNPWILNLHVSIAVSTVLLYVVMIYTGRKMLSGQEQFRGRHRLLGYGTLLMRILTFVTSFWAVIPKE
jgi:uncharacterized membrane protein YozB (DUF420 family)